MRRYVRGYSDRDGDGDGDGDGDKEGDGDSTCLVLHPRELPTQERQVPPDVSLDSQRIDFGYPRPIVPIVAPDGGDGDCEEDGTQKGMHVCVCECVCVCVSYLEEVLEGRVFSWVWNIGQRIIR